MPAATDSSTDLLGFFLQLACQVTGARSGTLFCRPLAERQDPVLIHHGTADPPPALATPSSAQRLLGRRENAADSSGSEAEDIVLVDIPLAPDPTAHERFDPGLRRRGPGRLAGVLALVAPRVPLDDALPAGLAHLGAELLSRTARSDSLPKDTLTGLPGRAEFQARLADEIDLSRDQQRQAHLLFVNPDDFEAVNERLGRRAGDEVVREIATALRAALRPQDGIWRYGGVVFATVLSGVSRQEALDIANRAHERLSSGRYLDRTVSPRFSIGVAHFGPDNDDLDVLEFVQRAGQALSLAKRSGGGQVVAWSGRHHLEDIESFDRLSGIFTGNAVADYRHMELLWGTLDILAAHQDFEGLVERVSEQLLGTIKPQLVAVILSRRDGPWEVAHGLMRSGGGRQAALAKSDLRAEQRSLVDVVLTGGELAHREVSASGEPADAVALPLLTADGCLGCLFLQGEPEFVGPSELTFLRTFGKQLAIALDRARLSERQAQRREEERRNLQTEVKELRQALRRSKLVYASEAMESLLSDARRVADTDATILISGASGTGKELLAQTVHELSQRRGEPWVVVDCGAIATTLIESELFGHRRGAFTGAAGSPGRLAGAEGGTVLLDEIGELPLDVQAKLLRFVQERQLTPVGGRAPRRVDVRVLAATNRDLQHEVERGRFREDLFYRLNVLHLRVPPLAERRDDILPLALYFLEHLSVQYQKPVRQLSAAAERRLLEHPWPGNVRELQNSLMRAVLLAKGDAIEPEDLHLAPAPPAPRAAADAAEEPRSASIPPVAAAAAIGKAEERSEAAIAGLRRAIEQQLDSLEPGESEPPLGQWLSDDLLLAARRASGSVLAAAELLGAPRSTVRRQLLRAEERRQETADASTSTWQSVRAAIDRLLRESTEPRGDLPTLVQEQILDAVRSRFPDDAKRAAALLGVSLPTYRKRRRERRQEA